ncbi:toxin glutamine deamidase domain-containing protein [Micromonospora sp. WMMD882]|uniref:toxin glutamine deamidase domain-containing protein n=1 Tax=Micromonospora sp. WMMD882 TaxID=3015151 RepID=UPI00248BE9A6|nr:toxin glutamine deamidase domain-containing protein [Micromonospora sp. WMMD882]WBB77356.1 toxin glutamine deamidase domain-containing protein [Micromonospora sp. WMMD882]
MTVLPSPIPHPLDFCPWQLPGWVYEALDWVVGVEWPEGNEKAVWDLADKWYGVAATLAGPRADAITAANEVRSGYGAVGAVAEAFDTAWKKVADGDEAPLPLLLAVSTDLGRLVEECGCDIEGAKLEVWIELGILVVELLGMAVAVVLTAGAASPAAAAAITATRFVVQQIFKKLIAQLARKTLKKGMKEATERAAKQVTRDGLRGLGRNALRGGLFEAAEEGGVNLAVQGYQNSTGRRDGLDLADLGTSTVGGFAGGAAAPLAGLGRHATSRGGRIAEHFGREMGGEVIAEQAASLATGGGFIGLEDAARAAASGATGSSVGQADAALQARLDGRLSALAGPSAGPSTAPNLPSHTGPPTVPTVPMSESFSSALPSQRGPSDLGGAQGSADPVMTRTVMTDPAPAPAPVETRGTSYVPIDLPDPTQHLSEPVSRSVAPEPTTVTPRTVDPVTNGPAPAPVTSAPTLSAVTVEPTLSASPTITAAPVEPPGTNSGTTPSTTSAVTTTSAPTAATTSAPSVTTASAPTVTTAPPTAPGPAPNMPPGPAPTTTPGPGPSVPAPAPVVATTSSLTSASAPVTTGLSTPTVTSNPPGPRTHPPTTGAPISPHPQQGGTAGTAPGRPDTPPLNDLSLLEVLAPKTSRAQADPEPTPPPTPGPTTEPVIRSREWYEARWAADREALERRRYQGYFNDQRAWFEENRRIDEIARLRQAAQAHETRARRWAIKANEFDRAGNQEMARWCLRVSNRELRDSFREQDLVEAILEGRIKPEVTYVENEAHFERINDDVAELAAGGVETGDRSALTGDDDPPSSDQFRPYGQRGGLRPPLALHQTDLERAVPREPDGTVTRTADPRQGKWFYLVNDGGPSADSTRSINCLDCTLSLYETWVHGRPRVSAPRTFDGYLNGDVNRPVNGETGGPGRVERATGGTYQQVVASSGTPAAARQQVLQGYADLRRQLLSGGHGSFAFIVNTWEAGGAHAWVALNQNGTVLYLDPQVGVVSDRPPYGHRGVPNPANVVGLEALVVGPDGRPMPLPGRGPGEYSERQVAPGPNAAPPGTDPLRTPGGNPDRHAPAGPPGPTSEPAEPTPEEVRAARDQAHQDRIAAGLPVATVIGSATDLDTLFTTGVQPADLAAELDPTALRRLVPQLDERAAHDLTRLFAEPRVRQMLQDTWRTPPDDKPLLAETLVRQLTQRPDLVRMILATPELLVSLTARPLTLHHLASYPEAIDVLGSVLDDIAVRGAEVVAAEPVLPPEPTPLTPDQVAISDSARISKKNVRQPGFDVRRREDPDYRRRYLDDLYLAAAHAQQELTGLALRLAGEGERKVGEADWRREPKDRQRAEDKIAKYGGEVSRLLDLAAAKIEFSSLGDVYRALAALREEPEVEIIHLRDRFRNPQDSGYRDIQLQLQMSNGHIAEFRLHLAALDEVAKWEHALYEVRRDLDAVAREATRELSVAERAVRDSILRREQGLFWQALSDASRGVKA